MAEALGQSKKQTKRERQRAAAEARAAANRRHSQRRTIRYVVGGVALIAVVVLGVFALMGGDDGSVVPSQPGEVTVSGSAPSALLAAGEAVPDFSAPAIGGGTVSWSDYEGGPTVISIWAPWCSHCQAELPLLSRVMQDYPNVGFLTIVSSIGDQPGPDPAVFLEDNDISAPTAIDDVDQSLAIAFGLEGYPSLLFVGSDGTVTYSDAGEIPEETIREVVGSLT